jgi:hypothetical protein
VLAAGVWFVAAGAFAAVFQDWSDLKPKSNAGTYSDTKGSKLSIAQASGPEAGEKAIALTGNIVEWAGVWALAKGDLSKTGSLNFKAKTASPCVLRLCLTDDRKVQVCAEVRVVSEGWSEFSLPLSSFKPTKYPDAEAPKDAKIDLAKVETMQLQPQNNGTIGLSVGPLTASSLRTSKTGMVAPRAGRLVVQDFVLLGKNAYGTFADKESGSKLTLETAKDAEGDSRVGVFQSDVRACGWCGSWIRAGETWEGQDWRGYDKLTYKVYSEEPITLSFGFNDVNQNSYSVNAPKTQGKGWETVSIPMSSFGLNEYYQPEGAKKDAAKDLSKIETFNVAAMGKGRHAFKLKDIELVKK